MSTAPTAPRTRSSSACTPTRGSSASGRPIRPRTWPGPWSRCPRPTRSAGARGSCSSARTRATRPACGACSTRGRRTTGAPRSRSTSSARSTSRSGISQARRPASRSASCSAVSLGDRGLCERGHARDRRLECVAWRGAAVAAGYGALKLGWGPLGRDAGLDEELIRAARETIGPERALMIDGGQAYTVERALGLLDRVVGRRPVLARGAARPGRLRGLPAALGRDRGADRGRRGRLDVRALPAARRARWRGRPPAGRLALRRLHGGAGHPRARGRA